MANPTTNFGWQMPEPTDLVTDLPADFEVFGQAVDTDFVDLLGGTTGQVLSKTSNTDLDFTWVDPTAGDITGVTAGTGISGGGTSGTVTVTNSMATAIDAKGDLIAGTGADAFSRLAVGTNTYLLSADSAEATGLKWVAAPSSGSFTTLASGSIGASGTTVTGISQSYKDLRIILSGVLASNLNNTLRLRIAGNATQTYFMPGLATLTYFDVSGQGSTMPNSGTGATIEIYIYDYTKTNCFKYVQFGGQFLLAAQPYNPMGGTDYATTGAISEVFFYPAANTITAGTYQVIGVN